LGGRLVYLHQQPGAQLVVGAGRHKISVLIVQETPELGSGLLSFGGVAVRDSFNVETWAANGMRFYVVGDAEQSAIHRLAQSLQGVNK
jgi:anti-sigma factor RsiW